MALPTPPHADAYPDDGSALSVGAEAADQVFLSPRVVDRRAFTELSTELRRLVERAGNERAALGAALDQVSESGRALRANEAAQQGNLELTARALKRLDDRIAKAQALLDQASDANRLIEKFEARADDLIAGKIEALEARLEASQAAAAARVEALEQRLTGATREIEHRIEIVRRDAESIAGPGIAALGAAVTRAAAVLGRSPDAPADTPGTPGSLSDLIARAEGVRDVADAALRQLESIQTRAAGSRATFATLLEELSALIARVDEQRAAVLSDSERLRREAADAQHTIEERMAENRRRAETTIAEVHQSCLEAQGSLERSAAESRRMAESAIAEIKPRATAAVSEATSSVEALREVIRKATDAHNTTSLVLRLAEKSGSQMNAALAALEPWRSVLLHADGEAKLPEPIRDIVESIRREFTTDLGAIAAALRAAAAGAERAAGATQNAAQVVVARGSGSAHAAD